MSIGTRIKQRREELGYTQPQLAELIGVSKGTIGNYESNISSPNEPILFKLFEILKCDANYLYQDDINIEDLGIFSSEEKHHIKKYRTLDEYGKKAVDSILNIEYNRCTYVEEQESPKIKIDYSFLPASAGTGEFLTEEYKEPREYPDTPVSRQADIVIPVSGDSMEPKFFDGDELYVRLQPAVNEGEIGIFMVDGKGYVKKYAKDRLISLNPNYDDIYPNENSKADCIGKVLGKVEI